MDGQTRPTLFVIWGLLLMLIFPGIAQAGDGLYTVKKGDAVYTISQRYGVSVKSIEITNKINRHIIHVGEKLIITNKKTPIEKINKQVKLQTLSYRVHPGDSLYRIAKEFNLNLTELFRANNLKTDFLKVGQKLLIPKKVKVRELNYQRGTPVRSTISIHRVNNYNRGSNHNELMLLAKIINAESGGEDYLGQVAVGAVILNRLDNRHFPKSIKGIIYERTRNGGYQFTPVANGAIHKPPTYSAINAAKAALAGKDPTKGALFFYNPQKSNDKWIRTRKPIAKIGNHVFAK